VAALDLSTFSIGELAARVGVATSALRYYESLGLIQSLRTSGGQRRYREETVQNLRTIALAQAAGFTLSEIRTLNHPPDPGQPLFGHWRNLAEGKLKELDEVIRRTEEMKRHIQQALDCRCTSVEECGLVTGSTFAEL
jgi:MerR family redox-sensitive transcriptional activator SoxR